MSSTTWPPCALASRIALREAAFSAGRAEMRAGDDHGLGPGDQILVDVAFAQRGIGAVLAVEDEREGVLVADAQDHQCGEPVRVGDDAAHVDALARALLA